MQETEIWMIKTSIQTDVREIYSELLIIRFLSIGCDLELPLHYLEYVNVLYVCGMCE